jgi:hypothetical protein
VLAVQNAVDYHDLGVATSGATLFRSIGGSVGTAILGSVFSAGLKTQLHRTLPASAAAAATKSGVSANPAALKRLPAPIHAGYIHAFTNALTPVFVVAAVAAVVAFVLSWLLPQRTLRDSVTASSGIGESFAVPKHTESLPEIARALSVLIGREGRKRLVERLVERAGVDLSPAAAWLLVRLHEDPQADVGRLSASFDVPLDVADHALAELRGRGLVLDGDGDGQRLGGDAEELVRRLVAERRASLARLLEGWAPDQYEDLAALLTRLAHELVRESPPRAEPVPRAASG